MPASRPLNLTVHHALAPVEALWTGFQDHAHGTLFQTFVWCRAWHETLGLAMAAEVRIVTATGALGETCFILPLQIRRGAGGVRVLEWLGAPHGNYGYGLFAPWFMATASEWFANNWAEIVQLVGQVDAIHLADMPAALDDRPHPLHSLFNLKGANRSFSMALDPAYEALIARKRSRESRRQDRKKLQALSEHGAVAFGLPRDAPDIHRTLDIMFAQQEKRLAERGVHGTFGALERTFIHRIADLQNPARPMLLPYRLDCGGETLAVMLGGLHGRVFWALISSLTGSGLRNLSPGDLAMRRTIEASCDAGLSRLDFGAGDSCYKLNWADDTIQLHSLLAATSLRGLAWAGGTAVRQVAKRLIKQTPMLRDAAMALRRRLCGGRLRR